MAEKIKPGTLVIVAGRLATVQRDERRAGADGYQIAEGGAYARFASEWQVKPARIGENVCATAKRGGPEWCCPLLHLDPETLNRVRGQN